MRHQKSLLKDNFKSPLSGNTRDKNVRDVLIHLYEWQKMFQNFIANNLEYNDAKFTPKTEISPLHIISTLIQSLMLNYGKSTKIRALIPH